MEPFQWGLIGLSLLMMPCEGTWFNNILNKRGKKFTKKIVIHCISAWIAAMNAVFSLIFSYSISVMQLFHQTSLLLISDTSPVAGTFVQHATDSAVAGHVITSMLVDDVTACARECLLYRNCVSFNYEYKPTAGRELPSSGMLCELNDETRNSCNAQFHKRHGYKYYEKLRKWS